MRERLSIKRSDAWFWKTNLPFEEVLSRWADGAISYDWLVCPQGEAHRAVPIEEFVNDPRIFARQRREEAAQEREYNARVAAIPVPELLKIGKTLVKFPWPLSGLGVAFASLGWIQHRRRIQEMLQRSQSRSTS
jgi:hypothetical protein